MIAGSERMFKLETLNLDHVHRTDSNRQKLIHKAKMKSLRISVVIICAFMICWTPYYVMMIIFIFMNPDKRVRINYLKLIDKVSFSHNLPGTFRETFGYETLEISYISGYLFRGQFTQTFIHS